MRWCVGVGGAVCAGDGVGAGQQAGSASDGGASAIARGDRLVSTMLGTDGLFSIWASELESPRLHPYLQVAGRDVEPVCLSSDGSMLIYSVVDGAERTIHRLDAQGQDATLMSMAVNNVATPATLADENRSLLFSSWIGTPSVRWMELPTNMDPAAALPHADQATVLITNAESPALSPDGRWLAYTSAMSGRIEVCVRAWLGQGKMGPPLQVSREGGQRATWYTTPEGALQIRFRVGESMLAADFDPSTGRSAPPLVVRPSMGNVVSVAHLADGRILGLMVDDDEKPVDRIDLRVGFGEELARRVGGSR